MQPPQPQHRSAPQPWAVSELLRLAREGLHVTDIASRPVWGPRPDQPAAEVRCEMERRQYNAALLDEPERAERGRVVERERLAGWEGPVGQRARPLEPEEVIGSDAGLIDALERLGERPQLFVRGPGGEWGIVTRADVQRPAVGMLAFALIIAAEAAINVLIERAHGPRWLQRLKPASRRDEVRETFERRRLSDSDISELECLYLADRIRLLRESRDTVRAIGFESMGSFEEVTGRVERLRNDLAHGRDLLSANDDDPVKALACFDSIRDFAERASAAAS